MWSSRSGVRAATAPTRLAPARHRINGRVVPDGGPPLRLETLHGTPGDPVYRNAALAEREYPHDWLLSSLDPAVLAAWNRFQNEQLTGAPGRSWLDDLIARGPGAACRRARVRRHHRRRHLARRAGERRARSLRPERSTARARGAGRRSAPLRRTAPAHRNRSQLRSP